MSARADTYSSLPAQSFDHAVERIEQLVNDFGENETYYLSPSYLEARVRADFIDKFWVALGWDVTHREQKNPYEQEVIVEKDVNVEGRGKRADYAFAVAPNFRDVRFFVEAKKPSKNIDNASDYFQTVRYGWNSRTPIAVLTDFEQFRVLDCRYEPEINSVLGYSALEKFHYSDYADRSKVRKIYDLFSRGEVARGSLDEYAKALPKPSVKPGQRALFITGRFKSVDESFLQYLDNYRAQLAHTFKRNNPQLEGPELTEVTQRTLDRLVFMRFLEDKSIETVELVQKLVDSQRPWRDFIAMSRKLNEIYNGIIFRGHDILDGLNFKVDERTFVDICENLSHARSPYLFSYIPIHILGSIYERFLGKTIVIESGSASVQEKPEVRKAGGVYYTPEYIVRYIVENTVGRLIAGKSPDQIRAMRFADISCGSGSFLLGAYDLLLRYHRTYYNASKRNRDEGRKAGCVKLPNGTLQLSLKQKREILTNNIYGVDIDRQAVEVAQLSLYLKLLEDETTASARRYQLELGGKLLPSLNDNIICGNSLIDWDIYSGRLFDRDEERKVNAMSFKDVFPQIMKDGGFDAIIGNPPYFNIDDTWGKGDAQQRYIKNNYAHVYNDKTDILFYFLAKAVAISKGEIGFIVSRAFLEAYKANKLRGWLARQADVKRVIDFQNHYVFKGVGIATAIVLLTKESLESAEFYKLNEGNITPDILSDEEKARASLNIVLVNQKDIGEDVWSFSEKGIESLKKKIDLKGEPLSQILSIGQGMQTGRNSVFGELTSAHIEKLKLQTGQYYVRARNSDILQYQIEDSGEILLYLEDATDFDELPSELQDYLRGHEEELKDRAAYKRGDCEWWKYTWPLHKELMHRAKILCPYLATGNRFALDGTNKYLGLTDTTILYDNSQPESLYYLLGLLNSQLLTFRFRLIGKLKGAGIFEYFWNSISKLPIRRIDFSSSTDKAHHDEMVQLVGQMIVAKQQLIEAVTDHDKSLYERKCDNLYRRIDTLAYELYDLTDEEVGIIETQASTTHGNLSKGKPRSSERGFPTILH